MKYRQNDTIVCHFVVFVVCWGALLPQVFLDEAVVVTCLRPLFYIFSVKSDITFRNILYFCTMRHLLTVIAILLAFACCTTEADRSRMRAELDSINQRNRNDQPFTVADVEPYVNFFDDHGTPNDRLLAHYLLGRAYHDHGEAPMALQCYQDALDCADTLSTDCDYPQLARVYGQMAQIFYEQGLYREQLESSRYSVMYAWKGNDTLVSLTSYEQESQAYRNLNMPDSLLYICEHVSQLYRRYGFTRYSAIALAGTFSTLIHRQEFDKARRYMQIYESESRYFDSLGNVQKGREIYYRIKGLYFLHTNMLDSAEYYFRKELRDGKDFDNQHSGALGLSELYQKLHQSDSVAKYSLYAYSMLDSVYIQRATKEVERIQALHDYTRHQNIAIQEKEKASAEKAKRQLSLAMLLLVVVIAAFIIYLMYIEKKKKQELYLQNLEQLEQTQSEVLQLREHAEVNDALIAVKEKQIEEQRMRFEELRKDSLKDHAAIDSHIKESDIYQILLEKQYDSKLTITELRECRKLVLENLPEFNSLLLTKEYKISVKDFNVCILLRFGFKSKEVSNLLGLSQVRVSQICSKVLREVFKKDEGGATALIEILHEYY